MKVILLNPPYAETFWSHTQVLKMLRKKALLPPLGLLTLASLLPQDWELKLVDLAVRKMSDEDWNGCDIVMVTGMVTQFTGMVQAVRESKRRGKMVIVGGPLIYHIPEAALKEGADIVVKGEAEGVIPQLLEAINKKMTGIVIQSNKKPDLPDSSVPRYDLLDLRHYTDMAVQFSRGCPYFCEFCDVTHMLGRKVRVKSVRQTIQELEALFEMGWRRSVFFVDDNFIGNLSQTKSLLKALISWMKTRNHPFAYYTQASVNLADDDELLHLMVEAGFSMVFLGLETTDKQCLETARKYQNAAADIDRACERIRQAGLEVVASFIMGLDHEQKGVDDRLIEFAQRHSIPRVFVSLLQAGPGTRLWERLEKENRLLCPKVDDFFGDQAGLFNFVPTRPMSEIMQEFLRIHDVLYEPKAYLERCFKYFSTMDRSPYKKGFLFPSVAEIRAVVITIFRQGILSSSRWTFWVFLCAAISRFPSRLMQYMSLCVEGEHYCEYPRTLKKNLQAQIEQHRFTYPFSS